MPISRQEGSVFDSEAEMIVIVSDPKGPIQSQLLNEEFKERFESSAMRFRSNIDQHPLSHVWVKRPTEDCPCWVVVFNKALPAEIFEFLGRLIISQCPNIRDLAFAFEMPFAQDVVTFLFTKILGEEVTEDKVVPNIGMYYYGQVQ